MKMKQNFDFIIIYKPIVDFYKKYQNWILGIVSGCTLIIVLTIIVVVRLKQTQHRAWEKISVAQGYFYQKNFNEGYKFLDEVINNYRNTKYAGYAMYLKATTLYDNKDFVATKELCKKIIQLKKPKVVQPFAMYLLGQSYQNLAEFNSAIEVYNKIIKTFPNHFIVPKVYESLANVYLLVGDTENAKNVFDKMNILYPASYWSNIAQKNLTR